MKTQTEQPQFEVQDYLRDAYLTPINRKAVEDRLRDINLKLEELKGHNLKIEEGIRRKLEDELEKQKRSLEVELAYDTFPFPRLDTGFLGMTCQGEAKYKMPRPFGEPEEKIMQMKVPRFSIHLPDKTDAFHLTISFGGPIPSYGETYWNKRRSKHDKDYVRSVIHFPDLHFSPTITRTILKGLEPFCDSHIQEPNPEFLNSYIPPFLQTTWYDLPKDARKKFKDFRNNSLDMRRGLELLIPEHARELIIQGKKVFGENSVYLVAEALPEEWDVELKSGKPRQSDPLIVGVFNDKAYYIGRFDPTPLEHYVSKEFTS